MYSAEIVRKAMRLRQEGRSVHSVGREVGVDGSVVARWEREGWLRRIERREAERSTLRCPAICPAREVMASESYAYVLGLYLGDGYIDQMARTYRLRIFQDPRYSSLMRLCREALQLTFPSNGIGYRLQGESVGVASVHSQHLPCLFPQHGPGKKHEREIVLADWQTRIVSQHPWPLLGGLLHSDGCRARNIVGGRDYPRWSFSNQSQDIHRIFRQTADLLGLRWTKAQIQTHIARRADVALVDENVAIKR